MASADNDVASTAIFTASGALVQADGTAMPPRCRIVGLYYSASANGTITLSEGNGGRVRLPIPTAASASGLVMIPQNGILFVVAPYATVTGTLTGAIAYFTG